MKMNKIYRIIDANINRLMEGLRTLEEIPRFILNDAKLTEKFKQLRIKVKNAINNFGLGCDKLIYSRNAALDVGRNLYPESEARRTSVTEIITSNIKRCTEASRALEEFGKLLKPEIGKSFKEIRYELYCLEKELFQKKNVI